MSSFAIVGDFMLGDQPLCCGFGVRSAAQGDYDLILNDFADYVRHYSFVIGNLECVVFDEVPNGGPDKTAMKAPRQAIDALVKANVKYLTLANNHTMEYGPEAFNHMARLCEAKGIQVFGTKKAPYIVIEHEGRKLGLLGFSTVPAMYGYEPEYLFVDEFDQDDLISLTSLIHQAANECDYLIACPHWGYEFIKQPSPSHIAIADQMLTAGVDFIAGAHPHIVQVATRIHEKPVFFSLGNLTSDYWQEKYRHSIMLEISLDEPDQGLVHDFIIDKQLIVRPLHVKTPFSSYYSEVDGTISQDKYNVLSNRVRKRARIESLIHLLANAHKVLTNPGMVAWVFKRSIFIFRNRKKFQDDPRSVYQGPIH
ncbi:MAG: CapA family protein [Xanthomonadales bacterium]|nr:CapA family protein [Xanthomonadales bacterium]